MGARVAAGSQDGIIGRVWLRSVDAAAAVAANGLDSGAQGGSSCGLELGGGVFFYFIFFWGGRVGGDSMLSSILRETRRTAARGAGAAL